MKIYGIIYLNKDIIGKVKTFVDPKERDKKYYQKAIEILEENSEDTWDVLNDLSEEEIDRRMRELGSERVNEFIERFESKLNEIKEEKEEPEWKVGYKVFRYYHNIDRHVSATEFGKEMIYNSKGITEVDLNKQGPMAVFTDLFHAKDFYGYYGSCVRRVKYIEDTVSKGLWYILPNGDKKVTIKEQLPVGTVLATKIQILEQVYGVASQRS